MTDIEELIPSPVAEVRGVSKWLKALDWTIGFERETAGKEQIQVAVLVIDGKVRNLSPLARAKSHVLLIPDGELVLTIGNRPGGDHHIDSSLVEFCQLRSQFDGAWGKGLLAQTQIRVAVSV